MRGGRRWPDNPLGQEEITASYEAVYKVDPCSIDSTDHRFCTDGLLLLARYWQRIRDALRYQPKDLFDGATIPLARTST